MGSLFSPSRLTTAAVTIGILAVLNRVAMVRNLISG